MSEEFGRSKNGEYKSEEAFEIHLGKLLVPVCHYVKRQVISRDKKCRIDLIAYLKIYDIRLGMELSISSGSGDCTERLARLMRYRKADFGKHTPDLLCLLTLDLPEWYHLRYFWRFGFGINHAPFYDDQNYIVTFPPNGRPETSLTLTDPNRTLAPFLIQGVQVVKKDRLLEEKAKPARILGWCTPRWEIFMEGK